MVVRLVWREGIRVLALLAILVWGIIVLFSLLVLYSGYFSMKNINNKENATLLAYSIPIWVRAASIQNDPT